MMKKVCLMLCLLVALPVYAQDPLFEADFDEGQMPSEIISLGEWQVEDGILKVDAGEDVALLLWDVAADEFVLQMEMWVSGGFSLRTHADIENADCFVGHDLWVLDDTGFISAESNTGACKATPLNAAADFPIEEWLLLEMEVAPDFFGIRVDGELIAESAVSPVDAGSILLSLFPQTAIEIESIRVLPREALFAAEKILLSDYDGRYQDAIAELQQQDLIPKGGRLLFTEDYAFFSGRGSWFTALAANSPRQNIVMAGEITFSSADERVEICGLSARMVTTRNRSDTFVSALFLNDGTALLVERIEGEVTSISGSSFDLDYSLPHHFLMILVDGRGSLFLDGQLVVQDLAVEARAGTYGISLISESARSRCEGRNIWVYSLD